MKSVVASGVPGAGRKREAERQPGLLTALEALIEDAIRGDPEAPLRWVSRSQRNIAEALRRQDFQVSQKLIGQLLREQQYSCQAKPQDLARDPTNPDRNAQFEHINTTVKAAIAAGNPAIFRRHQEEGIGRRLQERRPGTAAQGGSRAGARP